MAAKLANPSVFLYGSGDARIQEAPYPSLTSPNEVIIRITYVGVCGSDVRYSSLPSFIILSLKLTYYRYISGPTAVSSDTFLPTIL